MVILSIAPCHCFVILFEFLLRCLLGAWDKDCTLVMAPSLVLGSRSGT